MCACFRRTTVRLFCYIFAFKCILKLSYAVFGFYLSPRSLPRDLHTVRHNNMFPYVAYISLHLHWTTGPYSVSTTISSAQFIKKIVFDSLNHHVIILPIIHLSLFFIGRNITFHSATLWVYITDNLCSVLFKYPIQMLLRTVLIYIYIFLHLRMQWSRLLYFLLNAVTNFRDII